MHHIRVVCNGPTPTPVPPCPHPAPTPPRPAPPRPTLPPPPAGKCTHTVQTKGENINLCWSPNGQAIAVGNKEDVITIIDTKSYKIVHEEQFKYEVRRELGGGGGEGGRVGLRTGLHGACPS